jgi:hypothetical protein
MKTDTVRRFVRQHGIVLVSAKGPVPNVADFIAGEAIAGSWWGHARGREIFRTLGRLTGSADVLVCRLVDGKLTLVHRRLWPALVRVAPRLAATRIARVDQVHTDAGYHVRRSIAFPGWVPRAVVARARALSEEEAWALLGPVVGSAASPAPPSLGRARRR